MKESSTVLKELVDHINHVVEPTDNWGTLVNYLRRSKLESVTSRE